MRLFSINDKVYNADKLIAFIPNYKKREIYFFFDSKCQKDFRVIVDSENVKNIINKIIKDIAHRLETDKSNGVIHFEYRGTLE